MNSKLDGVQRHFQQISATSWQLNELQAKQYYVNVNKRIGELVIKTSEHLLSYIMMTVKVDQEHLFSYIMMMPAVKVDQEYLFIYHDDCKG